MSKPSPLVQLKQYLQNSDTRTRMIALIFILGTTLGLPNPMAFVQGHDRVLAMFLWITLFLLAWVIWVSDYYVKVVWFLAFIASLLAWWKLDLFLPCVMMVVWAIWYSIRLSREQKERSHTS